MRAGFVMSEVGIGLRRNLTMTFAVIITVAISLSLLGIGLLSNSQVRTMKDYWYDKIEVSIFLCGTLSEVPSCAAGPPGIACSSDCLLRVAVGSIPALPGAIQGLCDRTECHRRSTPGVIPSQTQGSDTIRRR